MIIQSLHVLQRKQMFQHLPSSVFSTVLQPPELHSRVLDEGCFTTRLVEECQERRGVGRDAALLVLGQVVALFTRANSFVTSGQHGVTLVR